MAYSPLIGPVPRGVPVHGTDDIGMLVAAAQPPSYPIAPSDTVDPTQLGPMPTVENDIINPPMEFVGPGSMNIERDDMRFDPLGYFQSVGDAISDSFHRMLTEKEEKDSAEVLSHRSPESEPLVKAIESGFADKKLMNPVEAIRQAVAAGDIEGISKSQRKLADLLSETGLDPVSSFFDVYFGRGTVEGKRKAAEKMAADVVMSELMRPGSTRPMTIEAASKLGFFNPETEALEGQTQMIPGQPPQQIGMNPGGEPIMGLPGSPQMSVNLQDPLTLFQEEAVRSRMAGQQAHMGRVQTPRSAVPTDIVKMGIENDAQAFMDEHGRPPTSQELSPIIEKWQGVANKQENTDIKRKAQESKAEAESAKADLDRERKKSEVVRREVMASKADLNRATAEFTRLKPELLKSLKAMSDPEKNITAQALTRMREALATGKPPDPMDVAIAQRFLYGTSPITADFMGRLYHRGFGRQVDPTTGKFIEPEGDEAFNMGQYVDQFKQFIETLMGNITEGFKGLGKETPGSMGELPTPKTPEEAQKLKPGTRYKTPDGRIMVR